MIWIPLITAFLNLFLFGILVTVVVVFAFQGDMSLVTEDEELAPLGYLLLFGTYVIGAFTLALSQAGIVHIVYTRARGGDATLGQGLSVAFSHWFSLLLWSLITSTVGLVLRMIAEKSKLLGRIVTALIGVAWSLMTYFVVPAIVIDKRSAFGAIKTSGTLFKRTWGELVVSNITLGVVFMVVHIATFIAFFGLLVFAWSLDMVAGIAVIFLLWLVAVALLQSALNSVLQTLLYIYASDGTVPENFDRELLEKMFVRKEGAQGGEVSTQPATINAQSSTPRNTPISHTPDQRM